MIETSREDIGIVIGRFQVHELHAGHLELLNYVKNRHSQLIIFLGVPAIKHSRKNPLDVQSRYNMLSSAFPDAKIGFIQDRRYDVDWSKDLDKHIDMLKNPSQTVCLYGSRDSFIKGYSGSHKTMELKPNRNSCSWSGSEIRDQIKGSVVNSRDFRAGIIYQSYADFPRVVTTVDIAVTDPNYKHLLLVGKPGEKGLRFPGGFAEPSSMCFEDDALRELEEETGIKKVNGEASYIGSARITDWRYKGEPDKIKTIFFHVFAPVQEVKALDDVCLCKWFKLSDVVASDFVNEHQPLWDLFIGLDHVKDQNKDVC